MLFLLGNISPFCVYMRMELSETISFTLVPPCNRIKTDKLYGLSKQGESRKSMLEALLILWQKSPNNGFQIKRPSISIVRLFFIVFWIPPNWRAPTITDKWSDLIRCLSKFYFQLLYALFVASIHYFSSWIFKRSILPGS